MDGPGSVRPLSPPAPLLPLRDRLPLFGRVPVFFRSLGHREACGWGGALLVLPVSLRLPSSWPLPVSPLPQRKHIHRALFHFSSGVSDCPPLLSERCLCLCSRTSHDPQKVVCGVISASARAVCPRAWPSLTTKVPQCPSAAWRQPPCPNPPLLS